MNATTASSQTLIAQTFDAQQAYQAYLDQIDPTHPLLGQSDDIYKLYRKQSDLQTLVGGPVYLIPAGNLAVLETKLAKLNKRAAKLDVATVTITAEDAPPIVIEHGEHKGEVHERLFVVVHGSTPKLAGWSFAATLEHDEGAVIIRRLPTFDGEIDLSAYTHATPDHCDHCGVKRYRKDTYIVRNDDGTLKQVGSTCLADFIGRGDPQAMARYCEYFADWMESLADSGEDYESDSTPRYERRLDTDYFMGHVACMIRNHGWTSKTKARDGYGLIATAEAAALNIELERKPQRGRYGETITAEEVTGEDVALATQAIEWVRSLSEDQIQPTERSDYLWNLAAVCTKDSIRYRQTGIAASAIAAYQRELGRAAARKEQAPAAPVVEGKGTISGTIIKVDFSENQYGVRQVMTVADERGFKVWGTVPSSIYRAKVGDKVRFVATVSKSDRDETFGFFKRPTQATITETAEEAS